MITVSDKVFQQIQSLPEDSTFGYAQLAITKQEYQTAAKALERLQKKGIIKKVSKGIFYKPKKTVFGEKRPDEQQLLKPYLYQNGKRTAYITGTYLYHQLGLTTQLPAVIQIASRDRRIFINTGALRATPVKSYVDVTDENYQMLGFLDAMKDMKQIPDVNIQSAISVFKNQTSRLGEKQLQEMINYSLSYPPRVRALLGAILEALNERKNLDQLRSSLNPLTHFKVGIDKGLLKTTSNWNIQ